MKKEKSVATAVCKTETNKAISIRVVVHIPDNVHRKQDKTNRIYEILLPSKTNRAV